MMAGAAVSTSRSATTACGAGQVRVCLKPSLVIEAPNDVYPSTDAAVATAIYGRSHSWAARLTMSLSVPDETATGMASWVRSHPASVVMLPYSARSVGRPGKTCGSTIVRPAAISRRCTSSPATL